jgi:phage baseplate assembly protein V
MTLNDVLKLIRPVSIRVANLVSRAVVQLVKDSSQIQEVQISGLDTETRDDIERFQNYGFTSVPHAGSEAVVLFVGGRRDHGLAIAVDDRRYRIGNLKSGEVAVYTDQGDSIVIKRGGTIEVTAATKVIVNSPAVELAGNTNPIAKGDTLNTAIATLGTAIAGALTTMGAVPAAPMPGSLALAAGTTVTAAVTAFQAASTAALSGKVKIS